MVALLGAATLCGIFGVMACGGGETAAPDPPRVNGNPTPAPSSTDEAKEDPPSNSGRDAEAEAGDEPDAGTGEEDEAGTVTVTEAWTGTVAASPRIKFGGSPYCDYYVTLRNIKVQLTLGSGGDVLDAVTTTTMFEEVGKDCPNPPLKSNLHSYTRTSSTRDGSGAIRVILAPKASNEPPARLTITGSLANNPSSLKLSFHRIDLGAPFDWTVETTVSMKKN